MTRTASRLFALLLTVVALAALLPAPWAGAHSVLVSSTPKDGAHVEAMPASVALTYNEDINSAFAQVVFTDSSGGTHPAAAVRVSGPTVTATTPAGLPAGRVGVAYRVVSADSHPITGSIAFTSAAAGVGAATTPAATPSSSSPAATASAAPTPQPSAATPSEGLGQSMMYGLIAVAALVFVGFGVLLVRSDRRTPGR